MVTMNAMTSAERAARFRRNYVIGLGVTAGVFSVLAFRTEKPTRALAVFGAATGASALYVAAAWPATRQVAADLVADKVHHELTNLTDSIFKK